MNLEGKVILITGASSGIGADAAVYLSSLGASVSLTGRNEANLKETVEEVKKVNKGAEPFMVLGDLGKEKDVEYIFNETIKRYGRLDVLVNNAGILKVGSFEDSTLEVYDEVMNINVRSVLQLTKLALPYLIESRGNIINISSTAGLRAIPGRLAYNMSKSALDHFTRCTAIELGPKHIRVNSINPGTVVSDLQKRSGLVDDESYEMYLENARKKSPLGKVGQPREVSNVIAFLASDLASNITGVTLSVDGGMLIN